MSEYRGVQLILFGSPGVGKSYKVDTYYSEKLRIKEENKFRTVFHPDYKYGDFVGRLIPISDSDGKVKYVFQVGPFTKALAKSIGNLIKYYKLNQVEQSQERSKAQEKAKGENLNEQQQEQNQHNQQGPENVLLIIEELNRGNALAIFGDMLQLLDRDEDGWSSYEIDINDLLAEKIIEELKKENNLDINQFLENLEEILNSSQEGEIKKVAKFLYELFKNHKLKFPPNFHIIATINTSDESIYFLDSAFKRRWNWEYIHVDGKEPWKKITIWGIEEEDIEKVFITEDLWDKLREALNEFIKEHADRIRNIEDKQIGKYFLKPRKIKCYDKKVISFKDLQDKLAFFLWDSVFNRDKKPLQELVQGRIVTYADFIEKFPSFIEKLLGEKKLIRSENIKKERVIENFIKIKDEGNNQYKIKLKWDEIVEPIYSETYQEGEGKKIAISLLLNPFKSYFTDGGSHFITRFDNDQAIAFKEEKRDEYIKFARNLCELIKNSFEKEHILKDLYDKLSSSSAENESLKILLYSVVVDKKRKKQNNKSRSLLFISANISGDSIKDIAFNCEEIENIISDSNTTFDNFFIKIYNDKNEVFVKPEDFKEKKSIIMKEMEKWIEVLNQIEFRATADLKEYFEKYFEEFCGYPSPIVLDYNEDKNQ